MARRGDALYLRGKSWYLTAHINGVRYQRRLGKDITRSVALELAQVSGRRSSRAKSAFGRKEGPPL